jgi:hypothetical protein
MVAGGVAILNGYRTTRSAVLQPWP